MDRTVTMTNACKLNFVTTPILWESSLTLIRQFILISVCWKFMSYTVRHKIFHIDNKQMTPSYIANQHNTCTKTNMSSPTHFRSLLHNNTTSSSSLKQQNWFFAFDYILIIIDRWNRVTRPFY